MKKLLAFSTIALLTVIAGCATTEFKAYEMRSDRVILGNGGAKTIVDGMDFWESGEPPRKFKIIGIIDDKRPGGIIPMAQLHGDVVKKAREAGGTAVIEIRNQSQIAGYYSTGSANAYSSGNYTTAYGSSVTMPVRRNVAQFAVIRYVD